MSDSSSGISVLMTAYNAMPYIELAVQSILDQTFTDFELVIVNDGSKDDTAQYLDNIKDPRVKVFHEVNRGTAGASNFGLQYCGRKYIARMDADDVSLPTRLEKQHAFLEANPDVALVGSQTQIFGEKGMGMKIEIPTAHEQIYESLLKLNHGMAHGTCIYRNELIKKIDGYWKHHRTFDDWDMFLRMADHGKLANLPEVLYQYRTLPSSLVGSRLEEMRSYFWYAVDRAKRRRAGESEISPEEFLSKFNNRPWIHRVSDKLGIYALNQYRLATAEQCDGHPVRAFVRLGWAAMCSPKRTLNRLGRIYSSRSEAPVSSQGA